MNNLRIRNIKFSYDDVVCVYSGKPYMCMCGCAGIFRYTSKSAEALKRLNILGLTTNRYINPKEINDSFVRKVVNKFLQIANEKETGSGYRFKMENIKNSIFTIIVSKNRQYTLYIDKSLAMHTKQWNERKPLYQNTTVKYESKSKSSLDLFITLKCIYKNCNSKIRLRLMKGQSHVGYYHNKKYGMFDTRNETFVCSKHQKSYDEFCNELNHKSNYKLLCLNHAFC